MGVTRLEDVFASGAKYEPYVGRWSRLVAREFLGWLNVPARSRWLDVGCGTGALTQTILQLTAPQSVKSIDRSEGFIAYARTQVSDTRAQFEVGDAQALPVETGAYDAAVSGLMLNFVPKPEQAVREMAQAVRPGGMVGLYIWDYASKMQFMRHFWNAAAALDPAAFDLDEGRRFPLCHPQPLTQLFEATGLTNVQTLPIDIPTDFKDFDDFWSPFLGGQGSAPSYVAVLNEDQRVALRERLRAALPTAIDGSIPLVARSWAVRGVRQ
ncbi:MAG: class I SAM-dependent methyltransferase [Anaerolineae bacterium]|nr:class I SAM-dependent methyltransferase [Anaerolineae bacterium]